MVVARIAVRGMSVAATAIALARFILQLDPLSLPSLQGVSSRNGKNRTLRGLSSNGTETYAKAETTVTWPKGSEAATKCQATPTTIAA